MDKEFEKYGRNRLAEGKLPICAEMCSTKALLGGDGDVVETVGPQIIHQQVKAGLDGDMTVAGLEALLLTLLG